MEALLLGTRTELSDSEMYAVILGKLKDPIAKYLCKVHNAPNGPGVPATAATNILASVLSSENKPPTSSASTLRFRNDWQSAIAHRYAVAQKWDIHPISDKSIYIVVQNAEECVSLLISAIMNLDNLVQDNPDAKDRTLIASKVTPDNVEVTARLILIKLLERCITGYTGLARSEPRKEDKCTCLNRFYNVVYVLERWKAVCRDMLQEDSKIVEFVHQPMTIMRQKESHQATNNKRKGTPNTRTTDSLLVVDAAPDDSASLGHRRVRRQVPVQFSATKGQYDSPGSKADKSADGGNTARNYVERMIFPGTSNIPSTHRGDYYTGADGSDKISLPSNLLDSTRGTGAASEDHSNREDVEENSQRSSEVLSNSPSSAGSAELSSVVNFNRLA